MKHKRTDFHQLAGPEYRRSGDEIIYHCNCCGKPKLYLNEETRLYTCFVCGYGGRIGPAHAGPISLTQRDIQPFNVGSVMSLPTHAGLLQSRGVELDELRRIFRGSGVFLGSGPTDMIVGYHDYNPRRTPKYRTQGSRGITVYKVDRSSNPGPTFLFEGLFDWTSAIQSDNSMRFHPFFSARYIFTAGNHISAQQADSIFRHSDPEQPVYICFDNDKPSAAAQAMTVLGTAREVHFKFPPKEWKDWDDAIQKGGVSFVG